MARDLRLSPSMAVRLCGSDGTGGYNAGGSLRSIISGAFKLYIYAGPVPATAAVIPSGTLLCTVGSGAGGTSVVNMAANAPNGILTKSAAETWTGPVSNVGNLAATYYRFCLPADIAAAIADAGLGAQPRIQGTVGVGDFDLIVGADVLQNTSTFTIAYFNLNITPS
jgi:hypothetical protein